MIVLLDAPSNLGLMPSPFGKEPGVRRLPDALRSSRLLDRLAAIDGGRIPAPAYEAEIDPHTGVRNAPAIAAYSQSLADGLKPILDQGNFPLVLGGDCSILLGTALALKRKGRFGLCFLDGHQDLLTPETSATGGAAGMDLALVCGVGPESLTHFEDQSPLMLPEDVLLLGDRSGDEFYPDPIVKTLRARMYQAGLLQCRQRGFTQVVSEGMKRLNQQQIEGIWFHVDVDVLDEEIMPAVDSPQPDGLSWAEFHELVVAVLTSGTVGGMQVTILDPDLDPEGVCAEALTHALELAFREAKIAGT